MLTGNIKNWEAINGLKIIEIAFNFLEKNDIKNLKAGKYSINNDMYAFVIKTISLAPESPAKFESHKRYLDLHYLISGKEVIGVSKINKLKISRQYDNKDDSFLYEIPENYDKLEMKPGDFVIFFPDDGHMPGCHLEKQVEIHKIVIKILLNTYKDKNE